MQTKEIINLASEHLSKLPDTTFNTITISKPASIEAAINLSKIISKLSPLVGNLIEFDIVEYLNKNEQLSELGEWKRQDPGFPDTIFISDIQPTPGFEVKAWFPLATEITARFKDSQNHFIQDQTYVSMIAWLPEYIIFGKPKIIDILIVSGASVAKSRDDHYHNPPNYVVLEPEDTSGRTKNLLQTNTNGYKFQNEKGSISEAEKLVLSWGENCKQYNSAPEHQEKYRSLLRAFDYRLDTNFAKMNRIQNQEIQEFKERVMNKVFNGRTIKEWKRLFSSKKIDDLSKIFEEEFDLT